MTALSKRLRYEILRRDNHTCRYCGATAPEAILTVDHVVPDALGGSNDPANLVAACRDCNAGKSSSAPDASLVGDVSADALRWGRALREAAEYLLHEYGDRVDHHERFETCWNLWTYGGKPVRLPHNWATSVDSFVAAGLPVEILFDCIEIAMSAKHVAPENTFRYMCGVAWKKVAELREIAAALLEADGA